MRKSIDEKVDWWESWSMRESINEKVDWWDKWLIRKVIQIRIICHPLLDTCILGIHKKKYRDETFNFSNIQLTMPLLTINILQIDYHGLWVSEANNKAWWENNDLAG